MGGLADKWDRFYAERVPGIKLPVEVLTDNAFLLPRYGVALDLACGLGENAVFLAKAGLAVAAWDISATAITKLQQLSDQDSLNISARQCVISKDTLAGMQFDVIAVSRFLDRGLSDAIIDALKPGGLLFYQTFTRTKTVQRSPNNPDFLLSETEFLSLFAALKAVYFRDNALIGCLEKGLRNEAQFIGQKMQ